MQDGTLGIQRGCELHTWMLRGSKIWTCKVKDVTIPRRETCKHASMAGACKRLYTRILHDGALNTPTSTPLMLTVTMSSELPPAGRGVAVLRMPRKNCMSQFADKGSLYVPSSTPPVAAPSCAMPDRMLERTEACEYHVMINGFGVNPCSPHPTQRQFSACIFSRADISCFNCVSQYKAKTLASYKSQQT